MTRPLPLRAILILGACLALPVTVAAQGTADTPNQQAPTGATPGDDLTLRLEAALDALEGPPPDMSDLASQLAICLRPLYPDSPEHAEIIMGITVDETGRPGEPFFIQPPAAEAGVAHLRQLFRAEAALFDCAPLKVPGSEGTPTTLRLRVNRTELTPVAPEAADPDVAQGAAQAERSLDLSRADRREVQVRLQLAGFDPGTPDGAFGANTRAAIADWQAAQEQLPTGFLTQTQLTRLKIQTQEAFAAQPAPEPARSSNRYYRDNNGCLRYSNGRVVPNQSLLCDVKGLIKEF